MPATTGNPPPEKRAGDPRSPRTPARRPASTTTATRAGFPIRLLSAIRRWWATSSYSPSWMPRELRHPVVGYAVAVVLQILAVAADVALVKHFPSFGMSGLLCILAVAVVAIGWGARASLLATIVGVVLLDIFIFMPISDWFVHPGRTAAEYGVFILVGVIMTFGATQLERSRRAAEQLAASLAEEKARSEVERNRLGAVLDVLPVGVLIADERGTIVEANATGKVICGQDDAASASTLPTAAIRGWWPETGRELSTAEWPLARAVTLGETTMPRETVIETAGRVRKTILQSASPIRDDQGAIVGGVVAMVDITERKRLESRTRDALNALLQMAKAMMLDTEKADVAEISAPGGAQLLMQRLGELARSVVGCQRVTMLAVAADGDHCSPIAMVGADAGHEAEGWLSWQQGDQRLSDQLEPGDLAALHRDEMITIDPHQPPYAGRASLFGSRYRLLAPLTLHGALVGLLALDYDTAESSASPENRALANATARLATLVIERDRLEYERAQAQANAMALRVANQRMDEFLYGASHEFRNPLQVIQLTLQRLARRFAAVAAQDVPDATLAELIGSARTSLQNTNGQIRRMSRLVEDILEVARIQSDNVHLRLAPADLTTIVREAVADQRVLWPERQIETELAPEPVPLTTDADRVGQVVSNYLINALKYSPADKPVWVALRVTGDRARVEVRDVGPGLPPEEQSLVWQRFHRAPGVEEVSGSGKGLGLGLYIARTNIERLGGKTGVISQPGAGCTFWFTLPLTSPAGG